MGFTLLGTVGVEGSDGIHYALGSGKVQTLFAHLLVEANHFVTIRQITDELWFERGAPKTATTAIQVYVSKLRKAIQGVGEANAAGACIETRANGYRLALAGYGNDLLDFRRLVGEARSAECNGDLREAADLLHGALQLWRGEPLGDVNCGPALTRAVQSLKEMRMAAFERRIEVDLHLGRHAELIGEIYALVSEFPLWEKAYIYLMTALYRSGRTAEALAAYRRLRQELVGELGMEPSLEVRMLQESVLTRDPQLDSPLLLNRAQRGGVQRAVFDESVTAGFEGASLRAG